MRASTCRNAGLLAVMICCMRGEPLSAEKPAMTPLPAAVLGRSGQLVAMDSGKSLCLYRLSDGQPVRRFEIGGWIHRIAVSRDERFLLVGCYLGEVCLWEVATGNRLWRKLAAPREYSGWAHDVSFADDGESCIVSRGGDPFRVYATRTGKLLADIDLPADEFSTGSAALSPDGSRAAVMSQNVNLYFFDMKERKHHNTGITGFGPIRFSRDGKYVAFFDSPYPKHQTTALRVVAATGMPQPQNIGAFRGWEVRPIPEQNSFLVCGYTPVPMRDRFTASILRIDPARGTAAAVWTAPADCEADSSMSISLEAQAGVWTDWKRVTRVIDIRTGTTRFTIDNSDRPAATRRAAAESWALIGTLAVGAALVAILLALFRFRRGRPFVVR